MILCISVKWSSVESNRTHLVCSFVHKQLKVYQLHFLFQQTQNYSLNRIYYQQVPLILNQ